MALVPRKRRGPSDSAETAAPTKPRSREELKDDLRQRVEATDGNNADGVHDEHFVNKKMYLAEIDPSPDNARTRHISRSNPLENKLPEDHPDYEENLSTIKDIEAMADNLKVSPLLQPISVYRQGSRHIISIGHIRYFGMLVAHGDRARIDAKVYGAPPKGLAIRRFTENSARSDISLKAKLLDFQAAYTELDLADAAERKIAEALGASRSTVRPLLVATRKEPFGGLVTSGLIKNVRSLRLLDAKLSDDEIFNQDIMGRLRDFLAGPGAESKLKDFLEGESLRAAPSAKKKKPQGRPIKKVKFEVKDVSLARRLVTGELYEKFEWSDADFESLASFQAKINQVFEELQKNNESSQDKG